jgi:hypothetical protein
MFKNSVHTAKKTQHLTITKIELLTLFKEIFAVYAENYTQNSSVQNVESGNIKVGGTYCNCFAS